MIEQYCLKYKLLHCTIHTNVTNRDKTNNYCDIGTSVYQTYYIVILMTGIWYTVKLTFVCVVNWSRVHNTYDLFGGIGKIT